MKKIGAYEAKTHLPQLLNAVASGETIAITRHGEEIAHLIPAQVAKSNQINQAVANIKKARQQFTLGKDLTLEMLKNEGRA